MGVLLAAAVYTAVPAYHEKRFFEGYSPMVWLLIFVQASYGLCVGYAYKYADVLIKNLSTSATLAVLVVLSALLFGTPLTFNSVAGSVIIITTSYIYLEHANKVIESDHEACIGLRNFFNRARFRQLAEEEQGLSSTRAAASCATSRFMLYAKIFVGAISIAALPAGIALSYNSMAAASAEEAAAIQNITQ